MPKLPISSEAERITRITVDGNIMKYFGNPVPFQSIQSALESFLESIGNDKNVILAAHNGRNFDFKVLTEALKCTGLFDKFTCKVIGFCDTLSLLKKVCPNRSSYKQEALVNDVLGTTYPAHNACEDVKALRDLLLHLKVSAGDFMKHTFSSKAIFEQNLFVKERMRNVQSLDVLIANGVIKRTFAEKIAGSGLALPHLRAIYERKGEDGLRDTFMISNANGEPRVTKTKRLLDEIIPKLGTYFAENR